MPYQFTEQDKIEHLTTLGVVARHIDDIILLGSRNESDLDTMRTNVRHIEIMCSKPHLSDEDLSSFLQARDRGLAWLDV